MTIQFIVSCLTFIILYSANKRPPPGSIDNHTILNEDRNRLRSGLSVQKHFVIVHKVLWDKLTRTFGSDHALIFKGAGYLMWHDTYIYRVDLLMLFIL